MFKLLKNLLTSQRKSTMHPKLLPNVTPLEDMQKMSAQLIPIPGWAENQEINVRLQKPSLLKLVEEGQIPNELLGLATEIIEKPLANPFVKENPTLEDKKRYDQFLHAIAKATLVEPSYEDIISKVGYFTDDQLSAIFLYVHWGMQGLKLFRKRQELIATGRSGSQDFREQAE